MAFTRLAVDYWPIRSRRQASRVRTSVLQAAARSKGLSTSLQRPHDHTLRTQLERRR